MNLKVIKEDIAGYMDVHGGECVAVTAVISVDQNLPPRVQRNLVLHGVVETFCSSWHHSKIEELVEYLEDALDQLG